MFADYHNKFLRRLEKIFAPANSFTISDVNFLNANLYSNMNHTPRNLRETFTKQYEEIDRGL